MASVSRRVNFDFIFQVNNAAAGGGESAICQQEVAEENHLINRTPVDDMAFVSRNERISLSELRQDPEAVEEGVAESRRSADTSTHCCRLCGRVVEERLPHVLQAHLKAEIFQCRQCDFFSHSQPKEVFDHISAAHPDVSHLNCLFSTIDGA